MRYTGKLIGGIVGLFAAGPFGAALGALVGHQFDAPRTLPVPPRPDAGFSDYFFRSTFEVMGHVAKIDGRVSEREIAAARGVMAALRLDEASVRAAIACFQRGKQPDFDLRANLSSLRGACAGRPDLLRVYFEIQMRAALDGTDLAGPTRGRMQRIAGELGVSRLEFMHVETVLRMRASRAGGAAPEPRPASIEDAYAVLEVDATVSDEELAKAYRRQLSRHHPDKLKANGLPESMLEHAKQRTQQVIEAWELLRGRRGIR